MKFDIKQSYKLQGINVYLIYFTNFDSRSDTVHVHEETMESNVFSKNTTVQSFDPIVSMLNPNVEISGRVKNFEAKNFYLLDGHHRWKYAVETNSIQKIKCILVNFKDVRVDSYLFKLKIKKEEFILFLNKNQYTSSDDNGIGIYVGDRFYTNTNIHSKYVLYEFKRKIQTMDLISPISRNSKAYGEVVRFSSFDKTDLIDLKHLLPPKSTWTTPRI